MTRRGLTTKELEERIDDILLKQAKGEKLSPREQRILGYHYYEARCSKCGQRK